MTDPGIADSESKKEPPKDAKAGDVGAVQLALVQTLGAALPFIFFSDRPWDPYAAALTCYTVLVFSLAFRDAECSLRKREVRRKVPGFLLLHIPLLAAVCVIVRFSILSAPWLPRFVTQEGRKGSMFEWIVTVALMMLAWRQEHWMRKIMKRSFSEDGRSQAES